MKPCIRRCQSGSSCHGMHGGPWMLFTDGNTFTGHAAWAEALAALARWYEGRRW